MSGNRREVVIPTSQLPDPQRARDLAAALGGRWSIAHSGHFLSPARARKWRALYDGGFSAIPKRGVWGKYWTFARWPVQNLTLREAVKMAGKQTEAV